jgi:hypothetical protein
MIDTGVLSENMKVRTLDGEALGTIVRVEADHLLVQRGVFFAHDVLVPLSLVTAVRDGDAYLSLTREELRSGSAGIVRRTLGQETSEFAHEADRDTRTSDNLPEGEGAVHGG